MELKRRGWESVTVGEGEASRPGWVYGPFYIYEYMWEFPETGIKHTSAALMHRGSGHLIAHFVDVVDAVIGAEIVAPLADWDQVLARAKTDDEAQDAFWEHVPDEAPWPFFKSELESGLFVFFHADRSKGKEPQLAA